MEEEGERMGRKEKTIGKRGERKREEERQRNRGKREGDRKESGVCVCVCVSGGKENKKGERTVCVSEFLLVIVCWLAL